MIHKIVQRALAEDSLTGIDPWMQWLMFKDTQVKQGEEQEFTVMVYTQCDIEGETYSKWHPVLVSNMNVLSKHCGHLCPYLAGKAKMTLSNCIDWIQLIITSISFDVIVQFNPTTTILLSIVNPK